MSVPFTKIDRSGVGFLIVSSFSALLQGKSRNPSLRKQLRPLGKKETRSLRKLSD
jgi:hypothetical protein